MADATCHREIREQEQQPDRNADAAPRRDERPSEHSQRDQELERTHEDEPRLHPDRQHQAQDGDRQQRVHDITASRSPRQALRYSLAHYIGVDGLEALAHARRVPLRKLGRRRAASQPGAPRGVVQKRDDGVGQAIQIVGPNDEPVYVVA